MRERADDDRYQRYLLGELAEAERDALEEEYFSTEEGFQELQAARDELVDAYVSGALAPDRRARFEARYARTEDDRQRLQHARLLQDAAARARPRWEASPGRSRSRARWAAWAAGLVALAAAAVLLAQLAQLRGELKQARARQEAVERSAAAHDTQLTAVQKELERLRAEAGRVAELAGSAREAGRVVSLILTAGLKRDLNPVPQLPLPPDAAVARLTLRLEGEAGQAYRVSVQTADGREVWARSGLRPVRVAGGSALVVELPAVTLAAGHQVVVVAADREPVAPLAEYVFQVVRP